jgi:ABC-type transporter Mla maintaining outer membrane lipid asymmetry ATPase subunit MlaF
LFFNILVVYFGKYEKVFGDGGIGKITLLNYLKKQLNPEKGN